MNLFENFDSYGGFNIPTLCVGVVDSKSKISFWTAQADFRLINLF